MPILSEVSIKGNSWSSFLDMVYPVGSYYLSNTSASPSSKFGGTWSQISDNRFLCGANNITTGGANNQSLTAQQLPYHHHLTRIGWGENNSLWDTVYTATGLGSKWGGVSVYYGEGTLQDIVGNRFDPQKAPTHNNMPLYRTCYMWYRTA